MKMMHHFIASLILVITLFPLVGFKSLFVVIGGFLVDIDHYIWGIFYKKSLNPFDSYFHHKNNLPPFPKIHIFHLIEFWIVLIILSFFSKIVMIITIGLIIHMLMDITHGSIKGLMNNRYWSLLGILK